MDDEAFYSVLIRLCTTLLIMAVPLVIFYNWIRDIIREHLRWKHTQERRERREAEHARRMKEDDYYAYCHRRRQMDIRRREREERRQRENSELKRCHSNGNRPSKKRRKQKRAEWKNYNKRSRQKSSKKILSRSQG